MIFLFTGTPGASKTLNALKYVQEELNKDGARPVFYYRIQELKFDWKELDLDEIKEWYKLPEGSIIVIDEAKYVFPIRSRTAPVPEHVMELTEHRHGGYDIVVITQNPKLIDTEVRHLVGRHYHYERMFGLERSKRYQWERAVASPESSTERKQAVRTVQKFDKKYYGTYKSAEVHTHQKQVPLKLAYPLLGVLMSFFIGYYAFGRATDAEEIPEQEVVQESTAVESESSSRLVKKLSGDKDVRDYLTYVPRIEGLPHTAPVYDSITEPKTAPIPNCIYSFRQDRCQCYSQQATKMNVPKDMCLSIIRNGIFIDWKESSYASSESKKPTFDQRSVKKKTVILGNRGIEDRS